MTIRTVLDIMQLACVDHVGNLRFTIRIPNDDLAVRSSRSNLVAIREAVDAIDFALVALNFLNHCSRIRMETNDLSVGCSHK